MEISRNRVNPELTSDSGEAPATGRLYGGVSKEERERQRRERLVQAALEVFGEQGYHASTVRDICRQAELTSRYFYESFDGMEALFEAVYVSVSRELMHKTVLALQACVMDPEKLAEAALRTFLEFVREDPPRARVMLIDALTVGPGIRRISNESNRDFATLIGTFIEMLFPNIASLGLNPALIGNGLVGANIRIATMWVEDKCATPTEEILQNSLVFYTAAIEHARRLLAAPPKAP